MSWVLYVRGKGTGSDEREETKIPFLVRRDTRGTWFLKLIMQLLWEVDPRSSNRELSLCLRPTSLFKVSYRDSIVRLENINIVSAFSNYWSLNRFEEEWNSLKNRDIFMPCVVLI